MISRYSRLLALAFVVLCCWAFIAAPVAAAEKRLGFGARYFRTIDDLDDEGFDDIEDDGYSLVGSLQIAPRGLFSFLFDLEYFEDGYGGASADTLSPQALVVIGHGLYAGVGVGVNYSDDLPDELSDPFYIARAGFQMELVPRIFLDINANYHANAFEALDEADTDAVTLGALVRFGIGRR